MNNMVRRSAAGQFTEHRCAAATPMAVPSEQENVGQKNGQQTPREQPRRHLRFSLRTLFVLLTVAAALSANFAWWTRKQYRYASFSDAKASCDRNYAHSGRVLIATWGAKAGPYRRFLGNHFNADLRSCAVKFQLNGKLRTVRFATHDDVVVVPFENPQGDFLHLVYAKSKDSLTLLSESNE